MPDCSHCNRPLPLTELHVVCQCGAVYDIDPIDLELPDPNQLELEEPEKKRRKRA